MQSLASNDLCKCAKTILLRDFPVTVMYQQIAVISLAFIFLSMEGAKFG